MILAGDIGGTKTVLALYQHVGGELRQLHMATYGSRDFSSFQEILVAFQQECSGAGIRFACLGVAGPVIDGRCQTTNLPWHLDEGELARQLGSSGAKLLNDLEAAAFGMLFLKPQERFVLNPAADPHRAANAVVIAAGTGLGEAILYWDGSRYHPIASEGGHADFAPRTDQEIALLQYLRGKFGHVSYERILSGPGLHNIYAFLRESGFAPEPEWLAQELAHGDPSAAIGAAGVAGRDKNCVEALRLFVSIYGAEAGNLALKCNALGGVYIGGGIAPKILPVLESGAFMESLADKGRFGPMLKQAPVVVSLDPLTPLNGAARYAVQLLSAVG
jgi:glucokinase